MGWLVHGKASEHLATTKIESLIRLRHKLTFILIPTFPEWPLPFVTMNLQSSAGLRQRPHGSKLWSIDLSWRMCALTCLTKCCQCEGLNVIVGSYFRHSSLPTPFSIMSLLVSKSSIMKHTFPVKHLEIDHSNLAVGICTIMCLIRKMVQHFEMQNSPKMTTDDAILQVHCNNH